MKKSAILIAAVSGLLLLAPGKSGAQFVVKVRPVEPVVVERPHAPHEGYVWVEREWRWDKHRHEYVVIPGYWSKPRPGHAWIVGHWEEVRGGSRWVPGHWRRG